MMRSLWNNLSDPSLHLLVIALILAYLAFSGGSSSRDSAPDAPLPYCNQCRLHFLPGTACDHVTSGNIAHARP